MTDLIAGIDIIKAKLAMVTFFIIVAKFITKHIGAKSVDRFLMMIHRPAGYILVIAGVIHMVLSFRVFSTTPIIVYILGFVCLLAIIASIVTFVMKKIGGKWLVSHRVMTVISTGYADSSSHADEIEQRVSGIGLISNHHLKMVAVT